MTKPPKLTRVIRLDSVPLGKAYYTEEGYLRDKPILTSTGIFEYTNPDGSVRRELRLPDEVFAPESLASYFGKPIIITHDAGLITKENVHREAVGTILSEGFQDGQNVRAEIVIHDTDEMKASGLKELSLGYNLDLDKTPGMWEGQPYDAIQRNISINHLALVLEARAGEQARLNIDSRAAKTILRGEKVMSVKPQKKNRADGVLSPDELAKAIEQYKASQAGATKKDEDKTSPAAAPVVSTDPPAADGESKTAVPTAEEAPDMIEKKVQQVKDNKDRRDAEGEPKDPETVKSVIAQQDSDIKLLCDIIDTLLAARDFDSADSGCSAKDGKSQDNEPSNEDGQSVAAEDACGDATKGEENTDGEDDSVPSSDKEDVDKGGPLNVDSVDEIVRQRVRLGIIGSALNLDGLENMNLTEAKKAVIRAVRPSLRLDGKSETYINAIFDLACTDVSEIARKDTSYQKQQMFNRDGRSPGISEESSAAHRQKMIERQMNRKREEK